MKLRIHWIQSNQFEIKGWLFKLSKKEKFGNFLVVVQLMCPDFSKISPSIELIFESAFVGTNFTFLAPLD